MKFPAVQLICTILVLWVLLAALDYILLGFVTAFDSLSDLVRGAFPLMIN